MIGSASARSTLVITGVYLGLIYTPSNAEIDVAGQRLPQAYSSVLLIDFIPVASLFRAVQLWAAHVMLASVLLHALRVFLTGSYRKPRQINWVIGVVLLGLTLMAGFVGYALPYAAFAVTATGIGYSLARSIPVVGAVAADVFFGARQIAEPGRVLGVPLWPYQAILTWQLLLLVLGGLFFLSDPDGADRCSWHAARGTWLSWRLGMARTRACPP